MPHSGSWTKKPDDWSKTVKPEKWGQEVQVDQVVNPVVFHFRPHTFVAVSAENRAKFEKFFEENVGFPPRKPSDGGVQSARAAWPNGGISGSNGGWDDCIP